MQFFHKKKILDLNYNMNIVIPLGGKGERFKSEDYHFPKILTNVLGKPIITWVIDSLNISTDDCVTIIYNYILDHYNFQDILQKEYKNIKFNFIKLPYQTSGPVETILYGLSKLPDHILDEKIIIHDGDSFIKNNKFDRDSSNNEIYYTIDKTPTPLFSYIKLNENQIIDIKEKVKISDNANIGCYVFKNAKLFQSYAMKCDQTLNEIYISHVYQKMIEDKQYVVGKYIEKNNYVCLGTPLQVMDFCSQNSTQKQLRFCFDLDNTLVTYPQKTDDYTTVEPIQKNIDFLNHLKNQGHYIIIYTARRMRTYSGNVSKILKDVGIITFNTLEKYNIQYDELCFGKPHADFYIDDLAINARANLEKSTGFYINSVTPRSYNQIQVKENSIVKTSTKSLSGEIYYYKNIPNIVSHLFPKLISTNGENELEIEKIDGTLFSTMYAHKELTTTHIDLLFKSLKQLHSIVPDQFNNNIYDNYYNKLISRFDNYNYTKFKNSNIVFNSLKEKLFNYEKMNGGNLSLIHGDCVFSNIFVKNNSLQFIDMRGKLGNTYTIYGDSFYDYAKIYQSLIGYDFILNSKPISFSYCSPLISYFEKCFVELHGTEQLKHLKALTASLLFTLIPLHNDAKCEDYYNLIHYLI